MGEEEEEEGEGGGGRGGKRRGLAQCATLLLSMWLLPCRLPSLLKVLPSVEMASVESWLRSKRSLCSLRVEPERKIEDCGALTLQVHPRTLPFVLVSTFLCPKHADTRAGVGSSGEVRW